MANFAPYEVNVTGTDDETFIFAVPWENADGSAFPFESFAIEYAVSGQGCNSLSLSEADGISIFEGVVTFRADRGRLGVGEYRHGCRIRNRATGDETQVFDGTVTIGQGNFS